MELGIKVRRFDPARDYPTVYRVYSSMAEQYKLFDLMSLNSEEYFPKIFERSLSYGYQEFFMAETPEGDFMGMAIAYEYRPNDGHMRVMVYIEEKYRQLYGAVLGTMFINFIFVYYSVRKIYTEVYAYNTVSEAANKALGFSEETRFKEYRYYRGRYWDFIIFAIERKTFYERNGQIIEKFGLFKDFL